MRLLKRHAPPGDRASIRRALAARVRSTGNQGGRIAPHRAIATIRLTTGDIVGAVGLALAATGAYLLSLRLIGDAWTALFRALAGPLDLGGVERQANVLTSLVKLSVPYFTARADPPGWPLWIGTLVATIAVLVVSLYLRARYLPLAYAFRFVAAIQLTSLLYFGLAGNHFPYQLAAYVSGMMLIGAAVVGLVPLILGLTFYVMDVRWSQKIALTVIAMGHLVVFVPLQYALQSWIVARGSLLFLPVCFIVLGVLPEVVILIALYGWGMSWPAGRSRGRRQ